MSVRTVLWWADVLSLPTEWCLVRTHARPHCGRLRELSWAEASQPAGTQDVAGLRGCWGRGQTAMGTETQAGKGGSRSPAMPGHTSGERDKAWRTGSWERARGQLPRTVVRAPFCQAAFLSHPWPASSFPHFRPRMRLQQRLVAQPAGPPPKAVQWRGTSTIMDIWSHKPVTSTATALVSKVDGGRGGQGVHTMGA